MQIKKEIPDGSAFPLGAHVAFEEPAFADRPADRGAAGGAVDDSLARWRRRRLESIYAMVFFDALKAKIGERGTLRNMDIHVALGVRPDGGKDVIGLWIAPARSHAFWSRATGELRSRGLEDILIAVVAHEGEAADAMRRAYPRACVCASIRHLVETALESVPPCDKPVVARHLEQSLAAPDVIAARRAFDRLADREWGSRYPAAVARWRNHWREIASLFDLPAPVREIIRSTTAVDSVKAKLRRRAVTTRNAFASEDEAERHFILGLRDVAAGWKVSPQKWTPAKAQLIRLFAGRFR